MKKKILRSKPTSTKRRQSEVQLNVDIEKDLDEMLDEYAEKEGVARKVVVSVALRRFFVNESAAKADRKMRGGK